MTAASPFPRLAGPLLAAALAMPVATLSPGAARAQAEPEFFDVPWALNQWTIGRRLDESEFRYCVDMRDPDWEVAAAIADTIALGLLLEPQRYVVDGTFAAEDITRIYALLLEHCDLFMGFKLLSGGYEDWLTVTRGYYESQYVFVTRDTEIDALAELAPGRPIGAGLGSLAHFRLVSYVMALPAAERWPVYPMGTTSLALRSLANGTVDVALVWAPALWGEQRANPTYADLRVIDSNPLPTTALGVGMAMLSNQTFLRATVDEAITALTADGTIASILEYFEFPATAEP